MKTAERQIVEELLRGMHKGGSRTISRLMSSVYVSKDENGEIVHIGYDDSLLAMTRYSELFEAVERLGRARGANIRVFLEREGAPSGAERVYGLDCTVSQRVGSGEHIRASLAFA